MQCRYRNDRKYKRNIIYYKCDHDLKKKYYNSTETKRLSKLCVYYELLCNFGPICESLIERSDKIIHQYKSELKNDPKGNQNEKCASLKDFEQHDKEVPQLEPLKNCEKKNSIEASETSLTKCITANEKDENMGVNFTSPDQVNKEKTDLEYFGKSEVFKSDSKYCFLKNDTLFFEN